MKTKKNPMKCPKCRPIIKARSLPRIAALTLLSVFAMSLCGCTFFDASLEGMLSPPKLTKAQTEIYNALTLSIGEQSELIYPKSGEYRSPFVLFDMDDEITEEAIVFYREKSPNAGAVSGLRMNLLDRKGGHWVSVSDCSLPGTDIENVSFYNFGEGINVIVCSSFPGQSENALSVLNYSVGRLRELYRSNYGFMDIYDINDDGYDELFLVSYDPAMESNVASLVGQSRGDRGEESRFGLLSSASLPEDVVFVQRLTRQRLGEGRFLLFLDHSKGENSYGTQVLSCFSDALFLLDFGEAIARRSNSNIPMLYSTDIDGDGVVEVPVTYPMLGYEGLTVPEQMFRVDWLVVNNDSIFSVASKYSTYVSIGYEYIFYIPVRWQGFVTVQKMENNTVNFVLYDNNSFADIMLSVRVSETPPEEEGWEHYGDGDSKVYIKSPKGDFPMAFTADELKSSLYIVPKKG